MGTINIGAFIAARRKEKGLTQEELAEYIGVSKPAVSKWESGQSYPDILLLPVLASFFNTSIDALVGYEAQLPKTEIRRLYVRLAAAFAAEPFDKVLEECREYVRKYHSCWTLLFSVAQLYVNHAMLAGGEERQREILLEAAALLESVEKDSGDVKLARIALSLRAYCHLALNAPADAIDLLEEEDQPLSPEILLAKAYEMKGDRERARLLLQRFVFRCGVNIFEAMPNLMALYGDDREMLDRCLKLTEAVGNAFDIRAMLPHQYFAFYLSAAMMYTAAGDTEKALEMLEAYTDIATDPGIYPLRFSPAGIFRALEQSGASAESGNPLPRSEKLIVRDLRDTVASNPVFSGLFPEERFRRLVRRLERFADDYTETNTERKD